MCDDSVRVVRDGSAAHVSRVSHAVHDSHDLRAVRASPAAPIAIHYFTDCFTESRQNFASASVIPSGPMRIET